MINSKSDFCSLKPSERLLDVATSASRLVVSLDDIADRKELAVVLSLQPQKNTVPFVYYAICRTLLNFWCSHGSAYLEILALQCWGASERNIVLNLTIVVINHLKGRAP